MEKENWKKELRESLTLQLELLGLKHQPIGNLENVVNGLMIEFEEAIESYFIIYKKIK